MHEKEGALRSSESRKDIFDVNLNVYNLISIFLTTKQIKAFLEILNIPAGEEFEKIMSTLVSTKIDRKYYLVIAAGKTSTLEALRCFQTFEEWSGRVPRAMYLNDKKLTKEQQAIVDDFVFPQLIAKTTKMARPVPGIRIMDRAFLDLFAFSKGRPEIIRKAKELRRRFAEMGKHFEDGHIFFLSVSHDALRKLLLSSSPGNGPSARAAEAKRVSRSAARIVRHYFPTNLVGSSLSHTRPELGQSE